MTVLLNLTIKRRWFDMVASGVERGVPQCGRRCGDAKD